MKKHSSKKLVICSLTALLGASLVAGAAETFAHGSGSPASKPAAPAVKPATPQTSKPATSQSSKPQAAPTVHQAPKSSLTPAKGKPAITPHPAQPAIKPAAAQPVEPGQADNCAYCNMVVYAHNHEMGAFTAQLVTADGRHLFFDDVGCLLNYQRTLKEPAKAAWVRDFNTKQWVEYKNAIPVSAQIKTPMKYGVGLFKDEASANAFIKANLDKKATRITWEAVDAVALKRYQKRMEMQKQHDAGGSGQQPGGQGHMQPVPGEQTNHNPTSH